MDTPSVSEGLSFILLITPAGIIVASGLVNRLVAVLKSASPALDQRVSGALLALVASAGLYIITGLVVGTGDPDIILNTFAAWLAVAAGAIGIDSATTHVAAVQRGDTQTSDDPVPTDEPVPPTDG